jgi:hypothetical protein
MSGKVCLVTSGQYSGYSVDYVFATRELAEAFIEREKIAAAGIGYPGYDIEERDLKTEVPAAVTAHLASAVLEANGTLTEEDYLATRLIEYQPDYEQEGQVRVRMHHQTGAPITTLYVSYRRSEAEARKALQDLAARVMAERAGIA